MKVVIKNTPPIVLKNQVPGVYNSSQLKGLSDVSLDNTANNTMLIYNSTDQKFHLNNPAIDGGGF